MVFCGNCKTGGQTIEHVRDCFKQRYATIEATPVQPSGFAKKFVEAADFKPMALTADLPDSRYAVEIDGQIKFYEISTGTKGKWNGFRFLTQLVGQPGGEYAKRAVKGDPKKEIFKLIAVDPKAAAIRFGREAKECAVCHSKLSDPESLAMGIGPICAKRF